MPSALARFSVGYRTGTASALLDEAGTLVVFVFGDAAAQDSDPRHVRVALPPFGATPRNEYWRVDADVACGRDGELRWSAGGGWRCTVVEVDEAAHGGIDGATEHAYGLLLAHVVDAPEHNLQRIWNYLAAINQGAGDGERYRLFCNGRARGLAAHGIHHFPAATAIGHVGPRRLQVYALSCSATGLALENPRQVSAWQYPRQYGPTAPSFARAMLLPRGGVAISGTAAVIGHASHHVGDVTAQVDEAVANLRALLERARLPEFDSASPLKVYVRHAADADAVGSALARHLDASVPRILVQGDICRSELLVEIDGWRF